MKAEIRCTVHKTVTNSSASGKPDAVFAFRNGVKVVFIKILEGDFPQQSVVFDIAKFPVATHEGGMVFYDMRKGFECVEIVGEEGKDITFDATLRDGKTFKAKTSEQIYKKIHAYADTEKPDSDKIIIKQLSPSQLGLRGSLMFVFVVLPVLFIVGSIIYASLGLGESSAFKAAKNAQSEYENMVSNNKAYTIIMCEDAVKEALKAPNTADFPWGVDRVQVGTNGEVYKYSSYVDAQNSFGAEIRTNFVCITSYDKAIEKLSIEDIRIH